MPSSSEHDDDDLDFGELDLEDDDDDELPVDEEAVLLSRIEEDIAEARTGGLRPGLSVSPAQAYGAALMRMMSEREGSGRTGE